MVKNRKTIVEWEKGDIMVKICKTVSLLGWVVTIVMIILAVLYSIKLPEMAEEIGEVFNYIKENRESFSGEQIVNITNEIVSEYEPIMNEFLFFLDTCVPIMLVVMVTGRICGLILYTKYTSDRQKKRAERFIRFIENLNGKRNPYDSREVQ